MIERDHQRSKVYAWEERFVAPYDPSTIVREQAQGMVDAIWAEMGLCFPPKVEPLPHQTRFTMADANRLTVRLAGTCPSWWLLHELAHALTSSHDGRSDGHGAKFMGLYVQLLMRYLRAQRQSGWQPYCLIQECSRAGRALPHQNAPGATSVCQSITQVRGVTQASFPVRSASLLSRPDLAPPKPRRAAEGIGRSGATRSHAQRTLLREHGEDGEHRTFPEVSTVAHSRRSRIGRQRIHCEA